MLNRIVLCFMCMLPSLTLANATTNLQALLRATHTYSANFQQVTYNQQKQVIQKNHGSMAYAKPNQFRWVSYLPTHQIIIVNKQLLWIYDVDLAQVTEKHLARGKSINPAQLLNGSMLDISKQYRINQQASHFILTPLKTNKVFTNIQLSFKAKKLQQMVIDNNLGQRNIYTFSNIVTNKKLPSSLFEIKLPKGVAILHD